MPGTDLPPGEWSALLVGDFWPGPDSLAVLTAAAAGRHRTEVQCEAYADHLRAIRHAQLAGQDGLAADTARSLFARGEDRVRATAERNGAKWQAYESARHQVAALRDDLRQLAVDGNSAIRRIQESAAPMPAKVGGIVDVIAETQTLARTKAADSAGNILTDVQRVLDTQDSGLSARTFAATHGINPGLPHPPAAESLTQHVTAVLESPAPAAGESRTGTEACGSAGGSASSGGECGAGSARPLRAGSTAEVSDSVAALRAAASAAATAVAAGGSIGRRRPRRRAHHQFDGPQLVDGFRRPAVDQLRLHPEIGLQPECGLAEAELAGILGHHIAAADRTVGRHQAGEGRLA